MRNLTVGVLSALLFLGGCSRAKVTTEIKAGGAWSRTVALSGQVKKEGAGNMGQSIEESFQLPPAPEWKPHEEKKEDERTLTFERTLPAGGSSKGDVSLKGGDGKGLVLTNEAAVTRLGPGRFEYSETLRWTGPPSKETMMKPEDMAHLKAALPPSLASDENARAVAEKTAKLSVPVLFGPGDPLLAIGLLHPDLAARRISQRIGGTLMKALEEQFGDKIPLAQRRQIVHTLIETTFANSMPAKPDPSAGPPGGNSSSGLIPLMFILKTPGKIVSSNGETDDLTGEVYWALFPEAASLEPVKLKAVVELR